MDQPQVPRSKTDVNGRTVRQPRREQRLEEETEVHSTVAHALSADRQPPGLTDNQIGPLHYNDRHEERGLGMGEGLGLHHAARDVLALFIATVPGHIGVVRILIDGALAGGRVLVHAVERAGIFTVHHVLKEVIVDFTALKAYARVRVHNCDPGWIYILKLIKT